MQGLALPAMTTLSSSFPGMTMNLATATQGGGPCGPHGIHGVWPLAPATGRATLSGWGSLPQIDPPTH